MSARSTRAIVSSLLVTALSVALLGACGQSSEPAAGGAGDPGSTTEAPALPDGWSHAAGTDVPSVTDPSASLPAEVTDGTGAEVTITDTSKIIVGGDDVAEILAGLGLADQVYAAPEGSTSPVAAAAPVHFKFGKSGGTEGLLSVEGTLFIGNNPRRHSEVAGKFRDAGVAGLVMDDQQDTPTKIRAIASYVGLTEAGEQLATSVADQLAEAATIAKPLGDLKILHVTSSGAGGNNAVVGTGTAGADIVSAIGCTSVGVEAGLRGYSTQYSNEGLLGAAPDVILMTDADLAEWGGADGFFEAFPTLKQTPAGQQHHIVVMPDVQVKYAGPASGAGARALSETLVAMLGKG